VALLRDGQAVQRTPSAVVATPAGETAKSP
jgi:hypothetical protein